MNDDLKMIEKIIKAWEALSGGTHSQRAVQAWLIDDMSPAINEARAHLKKATQADETR